MFWYKTGCALAATALLVSYAVGGDDDAEKLHGVWVGRGGSKLITLVFGTNNVVKMQVSKDTGVGTYSVDWTNNPVCLDINWGKRGKVASIIELMDDTLKFENVKPNEDRPKMFTERAVILKRDKVKQEPTEPSSNKVSEPSAASAPQTQH